MTFPLIGFLVAVSTFVLLPGCAADIPCSASNQCSLGCCSISGQICGYGPDYCAADKCNAAASASGSCAQKSECDPGTWGSTYAGSETCPLNVCCSAFGFCAYFPQSYVANLLIEQVVLRVTFVGVKLSRSRHVRASHRRPGQLATMKVGVKIGLATVSKIVLRLGMLRKRGDG